MNEYMAATRPNSPKSDTADIKHKKSCILVASADSGFIMFDENLPKDNQFTDNCGAHWVWQEQRKSCPQNFHTILAHMRSAESWRFTDGASVSGRGVFPGQILMRGLLRLSTAEEGDRCGSFIIYLHRREFTPLFIPLCHVPVGPPLRQRQLQEITTFGEDGEGARSLEIKQVWISRWTLHYRFWKSDETGWRFVLSNGLHIEGNDMKRWDVTPFIIQEWNRCPKEIRWCHEKEQTVFKSQIISSFFSACTCTANRNAEVM